MKLSFVRGEGHPTDEGLIENGVGCFGVSDDAQRDGRSPRNQFTGGR